MAGTRIWYLTINAGLLVGSLIRSKTFQPNWNLNYFEGYTDQWPVIMLYFLLPMGLHVITNSVLFTLTAMHCSKVKGEIHRMQKINESDLGRIKKRFIADKAKYVQFIYLYFPFLIYLYIYSEWFPRYITNMKLFIVMGVSWSLEVLATIFKSPAELWYISDAFNILQGVLVFLIFVFKRKVWTSIQERLGLRTASSKSSTQATGTTYVTGGSKDGLNNVRYGQLGKSISSSTLATSNVNLTAIRKS